MKTRLSIGWILLVMLMISCNEQSKSDTSSTEQISQDEEGIRATVETYFDGWLTGDSTKVGSAMHETCHLKYFRNDTFSMRNRTQYLSGFRPRPKLENAEGRILSIDITNDKIAAVKCELETEARLFTDYFNMMNLDGRWYITDKISTNVTKEKKE